MKNEKIETNVTTKLRKTINNERKMKKNKMKMK